MANHGHPEAAVAESCAPQQVCAAYLERASPECSACSASVSPLSPALSPAGRAPNIPLNNIRINQQFAVLSAAVREFLLGPFLVTAPLRRHLDHNPQSRFLRSRWLAFPLKTFGQT